MVSDGEHPQIAGIHIHRSVITVSDENSPEETHFTECCFEANPSPFDTAPSAHNSKCRQLRVGNLKLFSIDLAMMDNSLQPVYVSVVASNPVNTTLLNHICMSAFE